MATLPQAADYGPRVKLVSNRIDRPGQGEMAVAEALERAAGTFVQMAIEHKQKDDALSYSHAKNEYLIADIRERDKLQDDTDFATQTERYNTAMKGHYERLFPTVRSKRDRGLFDAEARLMNARGTVAVGDNARVKEIDWNLGEFARQGKELEDAIMVASDAQTAQDGMFAYMSHADSLLEKGFIDPLEYEVATQKFVTSVAGRRLIAMDPKQREIVLERSITMAKTQGEPITQDQIRKGEGSGSIADFLPLDERVKMLEATRKGNEHDDTMAEAYAVFDAVTARYTDPSKVQAATAEAGKGLDPDVRTALNTLSTQYRQNAVAGEAMERDDIMTAAGGLMDRGIDPETMSGDLWGKLLPTQRQSLVDEWTSRLNEDGFGRTNTAFTPPGDDHIIGPDGEVLLGEGTQAPSYAYWMSIPRAERVGVNLQTSPWRMAFTRDGHKQLVDEQEAIRKEISSGKPFTRSPGPTTLQRVEGSLIGMGTISPKAADRSPDEEEAYWATVMNYHRAIAAEEERLQHRLSTEEEERVLSQLLQDTAFTDSYWTATYWPGGPETDEAKKKAIGAMPPEVLNKARVELREDQKLNFGGQQITHREHLVTMGVNAEPEINNPSEYNLARAHFAMVHLLDTSGERHHPELITKSQMADVDREILRRLRGN